MRWFGIAFFPTCYNGSYKNTADGKGVCHSQRGFKGNGAKNMKIFIFMNENLLSSSQPHLSTSVVHGDTLLMCRLDVECLAQALGDFAFR